MYLVLEYVCASAPPSARVGSGPGGQNGGAMATPILDVATPIDFVLNLCEYVGHVGHWGSVGGTRTVSLSRGG